MNKIKLLLSLLLFCITLQASAQRRLTGIVADSVSKESITYGSVGIYNEDDRKLVDGKLTDSTGHFSFNNLKPGRYYVKVDFIGYKSKIINGINLQDGKALNMGRILLASSAKMLNAVEVTGQQIKALNKIDKQVYKASQFEAARGGNAIDVLKNLPSVSVNGEGNISVRGSSGFMVMLNGKPVLTDAQTVLSQLPANVLENIELITAPSAKYDPDGKAGIINITTKKGAANGVSLTANAQYGLPSTTDYGNTEKPVRFGGDLTLNYRSNKWDISAGGNYTRNDNAGYREGDVYTINRSNNTITRFPSTGERSFDKHNYAGRFTIGFTPDANNAFSVGFFSGQRYQARLAELLYHNTTANLNSNALIKGTTYFNSNLQTKEGTFTLGNFDYTHTFSNKSTLAASFLYERANLYGNTRNRNLKYPNTADTIQYVYNPYKNPINGYRFKLDHALPIGKGKLESGYQLRYDTQDGFFDYLVTPATSQPDAARFKGSAKAKNTINAVYSQYSGKAGKLDYTGGLRYEYASRTVNLSYDPQPHELNLSNLFPSANLLYNATENLKFKAGYSKRVQRTSNFELNPIPEREHSETLEQGDPDLLPEFVDLAELGVIKNFNKGSFFATAYYQHIKNPIQRVNSIYADTILNRVFTNAQKARSIGLEAGTNLQPTKWWNLYLGANVYNYRIGGDLTILGQTTNRQNNSWIYSINANTGLQLCSTLSAQLNVNYLSKRATVQGEDSRFLSPNASLKKTFLKGRLAATLQWQNIDLGMHQSNRQRITTTGRDFYTTTNYIYETDVLLINLSFNLNKLTSKLKLPSSEFGEKEF